MKQVGDMDVVGGLFGITLEQRPPHNGKQINPLVTLFVEDDGVLHEKASFDAAWLGDLIHVAMLAKEKLKRGSRDFKKGRKC